MFINLKGGTALHLFLDVSGVFISKYPNQFPFQERLGLICRNREDNLSFGSVAILIMGALLAKNLFPIRRCVSRRVEEPIVVLKIILT